MPELPEVETTRRGITPALAGRRIAAVAVRESRLRWPVPRSLGRRLAGQRIRAVRRRAKYLMIELEHGSLILHLGMSGNLRVVPSGTPVQAHDHLDFKLDSGRVLRFNDPRRFGCVLYTAGDPRIHPLLKNLAPEPLGSQFTGDYLQRVCRGRRSAIKHVLMDARRVVGVGNIYANEALFRAGIHPRRAAGRLTQEEARRLAQAIKYVLKRAIRAGGTTLRNYVGADGDPGRFRQKLYVYERTGAPCRICVHPIRHISQGQRSTYFCSRCQR